MYLFKIKNADFIAGPLGKGVDVVDEKHPGCRRCDSDQTRTEPGGIQPPRGANRPSFSSILMRAAYRTTRSA
jgi:hypothetical protein